MPDQCKDVDQPCWGLVQDLKRLGLFDSTLIIWGGEFGRTIYSQGGVSKTNYGRDHHPRCFTMWMAGGGVKAGTTYGRTDDYGYNIADDAGNPINPSKDEFTPGAVHVHDLQATALHLLGVDHTQLTYKYQGRRYRLTDVHGHVAPDLLA
jgi:arylsulfatase A-like enzyme